MKKNPDSNSIYPLFIHETGGFHFLPPRTELPPHRLADVQAQQAVTRPRNGPSLPSPAAQRSFLLIDWRKRRRSRLSLVYETGRLHLLQPCTELPPHRLADAQAQQAVTRLRNGPSPLSPTARGACPSSTCGCADASGSPCRTTVPESRAIPP